METPLAGAKANAIRPAGKSCYTSTVATLRITRPGGGFRDALRAYRVIVDDEEVGKVRRGQTIEIPTAPGSHRVRAALGYIVGGDVGSETFEIVVADDEVADLSVRPIGSPVYKPGDIGGRRTSYLEVGPP
jgi:hypothetical protein